MPRETPVDKTAVASAAGAAMQSFGTPHTFTTQEIDAALVGIHQSDLQAMTDRQIGELIAHQKAARKRLGIE